MLGTSFFQNMSEKIILIFAICTTVILPIFNCKPIQKRIPSLLFQYKLWHFQRNNDGLNRANIKRLLAPKIQLKENLMEQYISNHEKTQPNQCAVCSVKIRKSYM